MILGVLEVFDVLRSIEPEYPGHFSIPSIFAWFMIQRSAYDLHCMKCILWSQLGMSQKASPPKCIGYHFCGLFCTPFWPILNSISTSFNQDLFGCEAEGRHLLKSFWWTRPCRPFWMSVRRLQPLNTMPNPPYLSWDSWDHLVSIGLHPIMDVMLKWGIHGDPPKTTCL